MSLEDEINRIARLTDPIERIASITTDPNAKLYAELTELLVHLTPNLRAGPSAQLNTAIRFSADVNERVAVVRTIERLVLSESAKADMRKIGAILKQIGNNFNPAIFDDFLDKAKDFRVHNSEIIRG